MSCLKPWIALLALLACFRGLPAGAQERPLDVTTLLERLISVDHLPAWTPGKTQMASTWDRTGGNGDGTDFKQIEGNRNVLLDADGPGCVHRIFTGMLGKHVENTRIRVFLDDNPAAVFDMPVETFFDDKNGPIPYPLVFHKTYPGTLFPIPFAKHCRIELHHPDGKNWGNYWQATYTRYPKGTAVKTLAWPLSDDQKKVLRKVCRTWLGAEWTPPEAPEQWTVEKRMTLKPGTSGTISLSGSGVIRQLRVHASPDTPESLGKVKMRFFWDGEPDAAVDLPIGYYFGNVATGHREQYYSLPLGVDAEYAYSRFPMPYGRGAELRFENGSSAEVTLKVNVEADRSDTAGLGRFHATLQETEVAEGFANRDELPRFGRRNVPVHQVLDLHGKKGKYAGVFLHVDWPLDAWWGEGDWLIWTDEDHWPPAYHGTGSEEYFNSGWCLFDRKAVSGIIREPKMRPGHVGVYSFHLNDNFPFTERARVAVEIMPGIGSLKKAPHAFWRSTAYWYEFPSGGPPAAVPSGDTSVNHARARGDDGGTPTAVVLAGGTLIDGNGGKPLDNAAILIEGPVIKAVGAAGKLKLPRHAQKIDVSGKWILPGFIDLHTHFTYPPNPGEDAAFSDSLATLRALSFMEKYLRCGVTAIREVGGRTETSQAILLGASQGYLDTIRFHSCGNLITITGGHGSGIRSSLEADGPWAWREAVRQHRRDGFRWIKICPPYTLDEVRAVCDEARHFGMRVTTHGGGGSDTNEPSMHRVAIEGGVQCIEHCNQMPSDGIDLMAKKGVALVPTLAVYREQYRRNEIPPQLIHHRGWTMKMHEDLFKEARAKGVKIGVGTDVIYHYSGMYPKVYFDELQYYVDLGASPMEAIVCATRNGAEILGLAKEIGTLEPGKLADLQVVDGDPLASLEVLGKPELVMIGGKMRRFGASDEAR